MGVHDFVLIPLCESPQASLHLLIYIFGGGTVRGALLRDGA